MSPLASAEKLRADDPLFDTDGAATYLDLQTGTLNNWAMTGKGPKFYKIGRCRRYLRSDLDKYIQSCAYGSQ